MDETEAPATPSLTTGLLPAVLDEHALHRGALVGRYLITERLGAGGMGEVYAAYDPELDRKLALKLLRRDRYPSARAHRWLLREGRALARLVHPNVVNIYDVGEHEGRLWLAMEFVAGQTLRRWLAGASRDWREILEVLLAAGRGVAAAHEQGLLHCDIKPDNIMVGDDGRVLVLDFGLARAPAVDHSTELDADDDGPPNDGQRREPDRSSGATLAGTPAYMAPELWLGFEADARSDQFALAVTAWEALTGQRFAAGTHPIGTPPGQLVGPSRLRRVIERGLDTDPQRRWPSVAAMLDALADDPSLRRRRWAVGGLMAAAVGTAALLALTATPEPRPCSELAAALAGVWDQDRRAQVEASLLSTQLGYAADTWAQIAPALDRYADDWVAARIDACEATHRGAASGELLDRKMACLDRQRERLAALIDGLANADATTVERAVEASEALPTPTRCLDVEALLAATPGPDDPILAARVEVLEQGLARAEQQAQLGAFAQALSVVSAAHAEAEALGYLPLQIHAGLQLGQLRVELGEYADAERTLMRSYDQAVDAGMTVAAADAALKLMWVSGVELDRPDDGQRWAQVAETLVRLGAAPAQRRIFLDQAGVLAAKRSDPAGARSYAEQALAFARAQPDTPPLILAKLLANLGAAEIAQSQFVDAREHFEQALAIGEARLGEAHPQLAVFHNNLGIIAYETGAYAEARDHHQRARAILEGVHGSKHPDVAIALINLANIAQAEGDYVHARELSSQALDVQRAALGPDHPQLAVTLNNMGNAAADLGDRETARDDYQRALEIWQRSGRVHPFHGYLVHNLAALAADEGRYADALADYRRAVELLEAAAGPTHHELAGPLTGEGRATLELGDPLAAIAPLERALSLRRQGTGDAGELAETSLTLARALWDVDGPARDRRRACQLTSSAAATLDDDALLRLGSLWTTMRERCP